MLEPLSHTGKLCYTKVLYLIATIIQPVMIFNAGAIVFGQNRVGEAGRVRKLDPHHRFEVGTAFKTPFADNALAGEPVLRPPIFDGPAIHRLIGRDAP